MAVTITGERELALKFDRFPAEAHDALEQRITSIIESLQARIEGVTPHKTGKLRSEIRSRIYSSPKRIAGYVSVYAPGDANEYPKAATLEYGSDKPRRAFEKRAELALGRSKRRIVSRMSKPVHIVARRYLRGPLADMASEIQAQLEAALAEAAAE